MYFNSMLLALAMVVAFTHALEEAAHGSTDATKILIAPYPPSWYTGYPRYPDGYPTYPGRKIFTRSDPSVAAIAAPKPEDLQGESKIAIGTEDVNYADEDSVDEEGNDKFWNPYYRRWMYRPYWQGPYWYRHYWMSPYWHRRGPVLY
ncbi:hypothetical protein BGX28_001843 [Mortierella sp. GBA30]|nr:hypothetical protein BGX28_001843 [Mortierella sp. GBA30]